MISICPVWQLPDVGKAFAPKGVPAAKRGMLWARAEDVRDCHRYDGVLPGKPNRFALCCAHRVFFVQRWIY